MRTSDAGRADPVDHEALRQAVGAFAAEPCQKRALEVLRLCMYGELLLDTTMSRSQSLSTSTSLIFQPTTRA